MCASARQVGKGLRLRGDCRFAIKSNTQGFQGSGCQGSPLPSRRARQLDAREAAVAARERAAGGGLDSDLMAATLEALPNGHGGAPGGGAVRATSLPQTLAAPNPTFTLEPGGAAQGPRRRARRRGGARHALHHGSRSAHGCTCCNCSRF